jgi:hypothetical protein
MRTLPVPVPDDVRTTSEVAADLRDSLEQAWEAGGQPTPRRQLDHALACAAERAADWVVLRSMSYLVWGLEHGLTIDPPRCRRLLDVFCP